MLKVKAALASRHGIDASLGVGMVGGVKATFIALLAVLLCVSAVGALVGLNDSTDLRKAGLKRADKKEQTDVEKAGYKGRVKSVNPSAFDMTEKFGQPVRKRARAYSMLYKFDKGGNKLEEIRPEGDTTSTPKTTYKYDGKGNVTEKLTYDASGKITRKGTSKYDEKGNELESRVSYSDSKGDAKYAYKYDGKGNMVEEAVYDANGKFSFKKTRKYDGKGNLTEVVRHDNLGNTKVASTRKYDENGNIIEKLIHHWGSYVGERNADGKLMLVSYGGFSYQYDERGYLTEQVQDATHGTFAVKKGEKLETVTVKFGRRERIKTMYTYKYDEKEDKLEVDEYNGFGRRLFKTIYQKGQLTERWDGYRKIGFKTTYKRNERGNVLEQAEYDANGKIKNKNTHTYKYDGKGNMLEDVKYGADGKIERKIIYKFDVKGNKVKETIYLLKEEFNEKRFVPIREYIWEFTYWN